MKGYLQNLLGNPFEITNKPAKWIINGQLDIKLGQFMEEKLDWKEKKSKAENLQALMKYGRQGNLATCFDYAILCVNQT